MSDGGDRKRDPGIGSFLLGCLLLCGVTLLLYGRNLFAPFTSDDYYYLYNVRNVSSHPLLQVFSPAVQALVLPPFYRPTSIVFFEGLLRLFGPEPLPFHAALLLLRIFALILALLFFRRLFGSPGWGGMAALALAVNGWGVEAAVWPAAVPDALLVLFVLGALVSFQKIGAGAEPGSPSLARGDAVGVGMTLFCGVLALLSKEPAIFLPFFLMTLPAFQRPVGRATVGGLLALDALYVLMRLATRPDAVSSETWNYGHVLVGFLRFDWWRSVLASPGQIVQGHTTDPLFLLGGIMAFAAMVILLARHKEALPPRGLLLSLLLIFCPILLTGGLAHNRYGALPSVGFAILLTGAARLGWDRARALVLPALALYFAFHLGLSLQFASTWLQAAQETERFAAFLAGRPRDEQTVLLWMPGYQSSRFLGIWNMRAYALTDPIYPAWIKELSDQGAQAVPLTQLNGMVGQVPALRTASPDLFQLSMAESSRDRLLPSPPSVYTGGKEPDIRRYARVLQAAPDVVTLELLREPGRSFFYYTVSEWVKL
ncbi:MAG: hypothetical protein KY468_03025 [Armatimonadetes bacterium]|nr:hypothetical protein [Armatimonadota bacterium]